MSLLKSHPLTLSLFHSLSLSHSPIHFLDMLKNFCFHVYSQKSLSYSHTLSFSPFIIICLPKILDTRTEEQMRNMVIHHEIKVYDKALEDASWGLNAAGMRLYNEAIIMADTRQDLFSLEDNVITALRSIIGKWHCL